MEYNNTSSLRDREREIFLDLESGGNVGSSGDLNNGNIPVVVDERQGNRFLNKLTNGVLSYNISSATSGSDSDSDSNLDKNSQYYYSIDDIQLVIDKNGGRRQQEEQVPLLDKEISQEKHQSATNSKKASKPPRPPKGPSLDACDLMLVKEVSELVMKKRARKERIKAFKRSRDAKLASASSSSFNTTLCALIVTVVFLLIIIFQGISWRSGSNSILHDSPGPTTGTDGLISIQVFSNLLPNHGIAPSTESPSSSVEQNIGSGFTFPS